MSGWPFNNLRMMGYDLIVADPPWSFELYGEGGEEKSAHAQYECMTLDDIKALPVGQLARGDCLLLLWTCGWAMARGDATDTARAWGFTPISEIVWHKVTVNGKTRMGPGYRVRTMHEPILLATMGNPIHKAFPSYFPGVAREHSRKPDEFYDIVRDRTANMLHRADLFTRETRSGFDGWGKEHGKFDQPTGEEAND